MIVTYDLRYASDHFPGIGTHAWELLRALLSIEGPERYRVLWNPSLPCTRWDVTSLASHPRVEWRSCDLSPLGWSTTRTTGAWLAREGGDVYFSPFSLRPSGAAQPAILTLHDVLPLVPLGHAPWWRRARFALALLGTAKATVVLTSSEFSRSEIARLTSIPIDRVRVVRLGVPAAPTEAPVRPTSAPHGPFALTVGINRPHKNHSVVAQAWRRFGGAPPLPLVAVGPEDSRFPSWRVLAGEASGIVPLGRVPTAALEWLYQNATLVVHPSRYEGFGFPLLEAASRGAPVICSDIPALREIGEDVARFVSVDDPGEWARAVAEVSADAGLREHMRHQGLRLAAAHSYARCAEQVLRICREVAHDASPNARNRLANQL